VNKLLAVIKVARLSDLLVLIGVWSEEYVKMNHAGPGLRPG